MAPDYRFVQRRRKGTHIQRMTSDIGGPSSSSGKWDPNSQLPGQGNDEGEERGQATPPKGDFQSRGLDEPQASQGPAGGYGKENARPVSPPRSSSSDGRRASPAKGGAPLLRRMVYSPPPALRPALFSPLWAAPSGSPTSSDDLLNPMSTAAALDSWWIGGGVAALRPGGEGKRATAQDASGSEGGDATSETGEERWDGDSDRGEGCGGKSATGTSNRSISASSDQEAREELTLQESGRQGTDESVATSRAGVAADGSDRTTAEREEQGLPQGGEGMVKGMVDDLIDVVAEDSQPVAVGAAGSGGGGGNGGSSAEPHEDTWAGQAGGVRSSAGGRGVSQNADAALSAVLPGEGKGMEVGEEAMTSSLSSTPAPKPTSIPKPTAAVPETATAPAPSSNTTSSQRSSRNRAAAASSASTRRSEASGYDVIVTAMEPEPRDGMCSVGWIGLLSCGPGGHGRPYVAYRITIRRRGGGEGKENEMSTIRRYSELLQYHHMVRES